MTDIALRVENLSKLYPIGAAQQRHDTLRNTLVSFLPQISRISRMKEKKNPSNPCNPWQEQWKHISHGFHRLHGLKREKKSV